MITPSLFLQQYQRSLKSWQWRKNRSPLPRLEHDCDEESTGTRAAPTRWGCTSAGSPGRGPAPRARGGKHAAHTDQRRLARLHADEDNNEDNNDDK